MGGGGLTELRMGIQPRPDRSPADCQGLHAGKGFGNPDNIGIQHRDIAGEFLAKGHRRGVLEMSASDLDDAGEFTGLGMEGIPQLTDRGKKHLPHHGHRGDIHRRREGVV